MPTTTASKSGLRAAATARTSKAAQRTPLPPKDLQAKIADAREAVAEAKPKPAKVPVQRAAKGETTLKESRAALVAERTALAAKALTVRPVKAAKPEPTTPTKASKYANEFAALGWEPEITTTDALVELIAKRGTEAIYLAWMREAHVSGTSTYTIQDRTVKVRNPAEAMRIAALKPDEAAAKQQKVSSNKQFRKRATGPTIRSIPFDFATATDEQIISAIEGRRISWHNVYGVVTETATVGNRKCITVQTHEAGHRIVSFVDPENGYRAFRLDRLENVGRKVDLLRIRQQIIASLSQREKGSKAKAA